MQTNPDKTTKEETQGKWEHILPTVSECFQDLSYRRYSKKFGVLRCFPN